MGTLEQPLNGVWGLAKVSLADARMPRLASLKYTMRTPPMSDVFRRLSKGVNRKVGMRCRTIPVERKEVKVLRKA